MALQDIVILEDEGKQFGATLAVPASGAGQAVLLLPEVYGVNEDIRGIAAWLAEAGYVVLVPDLFWQQDAGVTFAYADREAAGAAFRALGAFDGYHALVEPALAALKARPEVSGERVALLGIGMGGIIAYRALANGQGDLGAVYYPALLDLALAPQFDAPLLYQVAQNDKIARPGLYDDAKTAFADRPNVEIVLHEGAEHGFASPGRPEYDQAAADRANALTLAFLEKAFERELS